jgi:predicted amidohydrolase
MSAKLRIAAAQYPLDALPSLDAYQQKVTGWVERAVAQGADVLVFPEYAAMELAMLGRAKESLGAEIDAVTRLIPDFDEMHAALAIRHGVTIIGGSFLERRNGQVVNAGHIFGPTGVKGRFEKRIPTPWERIDAGVAQGGQLAIFDTGAVRLGIAICYDIEFPLIGRALAEAGAEVILVPSNTEAASGYWRVRIGAMARALENQLYTVHSAVVGELPELACSPKNHGAAGIFGPADSGLPDDGILALGAMNRPEWLIETIDLELIRTVRREGGVRNFEDWRLQPGAALLPPVANVDISGRIS